MGTDRPPGPGGFHSAGLPAWLLSVAASGGECRGSPRAGASREAGREWEMESVPAAPQQLDN